MELRVTTNETLKREKKYDCTDDFSRKFVEYLCTYHWLNYNKVSILCDVDTVGICEMSDFWVAGSNGSNTDT